MRITKSAVAATYESILRCSRHQLLEHGWDATTTRAIAQQVGIAGGTLFNYFPTKESIVVTLLTHSVQAAEIEYLAAQTGDEALEEALFAWIWRQFKHLQPYRAVLAEAQSRLLPPLARGPDEPSSAFLRRLELDRLEQIVAEHGQPPLSPVLIQLYWTLFLGVMAHWAADRSPHHEDTLALLDRSLILFCGALEAASSKPASE